MADKVGQNMTEYDKTSQFHKDLKVIAIHSNIAWFSILYKKNIHILMSIIIVQRLEDVELQRPAQQVENQILLSWGEGI